jgi:sec-independent protein translocase protein TatA
MNNLILLSMPGGQEWLFILLIVLVLFGARRLPEVAQNLGKGIREFKKSMRDVQSEIESADPNKTKLEGPKTEDKPNTSNPK